MAQKVDYDQGIEDIKSTIHLKGINLAEHSLQFNTLIRKFSEPHLREGMVSHTPLLRSLPTTHTPIQKSNSPFSLVADCIGAQLQLRGPGCDPRRE